MLKALKCSVGREWCVMGANGQVSMGDGSRSCFVFPQRVSSVQGANKEPVESHSATSTSPQCSFSWMFQRLEDCLEVWVKTASDNSVEMSIDGLFNDPTLKNQRLCNKFHVFRCFRIFAQNSYLGLMTQIHISNNVSYKQK